MREEKVIKKMTKKFWRDFCAEMKARNLKSTFTQFFKSNNYSHKFSNIDL